MNNIRNRDPRARWLAQVLESQHCQTGIVDEMFDVLRLFFSKAKQSRRRETMLSAVALENIILGTPVPMIRLSPMLAPKQIQSRRCAAIDRSCAN